MSQRAEQVAASIRRALQELLARGLNDPRIRGLVSIVSVRVTDDLAEAHVRVSVMPDQHSALTIKGLQSACGHLQGRLARSSTLRRVPRLRFSLDESMRQVAALDGALRAAAATPADEASPVSHEPSPGEANPT